VPPPDTLAALGVDPPVPSDPAPPAEPAREASPHGFGFQPGLEGLRGLAVLAVLVFHGGFSWAVGGFLGVSTFFTLSGFLITTLLVAERRRQGKVALRQFWVRRFRRLMPAALVCLAGVLVFAATVATPAQLETLRGDMLAALFYVANWRFIAVDASYAELFAAPSPVLHFWSLAIEEQFYLVLPLVVVGLLAAGRGSRRPLAVALGVATVASLAWSAVVVGRSVDAAYYSTFTRAAELLLGALLALVLVAPRVQRGVGSPRVQRAVLGGGLVALVACVAAWASVSQTDLWLYRGGLGVYALLTAVLILAVMQPGPLKAAVANPVLRWLGRISYGAYLYHWPIFLWLTPLRTGLSEWPLFGLRMAVTLAAAELSYRLIEHPVRTGARITGWRPFVVAPLTVTLLVVGIVRVAAPPAEGDVITFASTIEEPEAPLFDEAEVAAAPVPTTAPPAPAQPDLSVYAVPPAPELPPPPALGVGEAPRMYLAGDSAMFTLGEGLALWARDTGAARVWNAGKLGCGVGRGGLRSYVGQLQGQEPNCPEVPFGWYEDARKLRPHVTVLMFGIWDVTDRLLDGEQTWRSVGDPLYDQFLRREIAEAVDILQGQGSIVVLLTHPRIQTGITEQLAGPFSESDPVRMQRLNQLMVEVAATRPRTRVLDLAGHMASRPQGELDLGERPDGIHWTPNTARVLADWLGPQLTAIAREEPTDPGVVIMSS
jgi:peptidoglycan/LPS O-acetylase OafA/YrhL